MRKLLTLSALFLPLLALRAAAATPAETLTADFGEAGLSALRAKGYLVLQGKPGAYRLQDVHWKSLGELARQSAAVADLTLALTRLKASEPIGDSAQPPFLALSQLPSEGLMTAELHGLVSALAGYHAEWQLLAGGPVPLPEGANAVNLFETPWGKAFAGRTHADLVEEPLALAKPFFESELSGPKPEPKAIAHFLEYVKARYQADAAPTLEADAKADLASEELRGWIRKYLTDQRRLLTLKRLRKAAEAIERKSAKELKSLQDVAQVFETKTGLIAELEGLPKASADGLLKLKSTGPHLQQPARLGQFEMGDAAVATSGYWVDGLEEGKSAELEETTYIQTERGFSSVETRQVKRGNGGPYALSRRLPLNSSRSFTFRTVVSGASGSVVADAVEVPVSPDFEMSLRKAAAAEQSYRSCEFKEAETAYGAVADLIAEPAKEKSQYKDLLASITARRKDAVRGAAALVKLEEAVAAARPDASPDLCAYKTQRTEAAIKAVKALPPGCDKLLPELERQAALIRRRGADQQAFLKAVDAAKSQRKDCAFSVAMDTLAGGLAVLDADPAARCGPAEAAAKTAEADLPVIRADQLWGAAFDDQLATAQAEASLKTRLSQLTSLITRISSLPTASCFSKQSSKAQSLAEKAGKELTDAEAAGTAAEVLGDKTQGQTEAEVTAERGKLVAEAESQQKRKAEEQNPPAAKPEPPPVPEAPKVVAAKGSKARLACLEEGFKATKETIDCNGDSFDILELKKLREKFPVMKAKAKPAKAKPAKPAAKGKAPAKKG